MIEDELKKIIIDRYGSIQEFAKEIGIAKTTIHGILNRGVNNASVLNIIKICQELQISTDGLAEGKIIYTKSVEKKIDLKELFRIWRQEIYSYDKLTLNGKTLTEDETLDFLDSIDLGIERIIRKRKRG